MISAKKVRCRKTNTDLYINTLPETKIVPKHRPSQKEIHHPIFDFQGATLVSGSVLVVSRGLLASCRVYGFPCEFQQDVGRRRCRFFENTRSWLRGDLYIMGKDL